MFAASRCPKCGRIHGLEIPVKTTTCRLCGKRYDPNKVAFIKVFKDNNTLRTFLQMERTRGADAVYTTVSGNEKDPSTIMASARPGRVRTMKLVLEALSFGGMTEEQIIDSLGPEIDGTSISNCLDEMQREGMIFIDKNGLYHIV